MVSQKLHFKFCCRNYFLYRSKPWPVYRLSQPLIWNHYQIAYKKSIFQLISQCILSICYLTSVVVVVVPDVELLDDSSFLEQEMMVFAEKQEIRNFYKIFLFFSSIPKVKNYNAKVNNNNMNWLILQEEW